jgi:hypothetical protein
MIFDVFFKDDSILGFLAQPNALLIMITQQNCFILAKIQNKHPNVVSQIKQKHGSSDADTAKLTKKARKGQRLVK